MSGRSDLQNHMVDGVDRFGCRQGECGGICIRFSTAVDEQIALSFDFPSVGEKPPQFKVVAG